MKAKCNQLRIRYGHYDFYYNNDYKQAFANEGCRNCNDGLSMMLAV